MNKSSVFCKLNVSGVCRPLGITSIGVDHDHMFSIYVEVFCMC